MKKIFIALSALIAVSCSSKQQVQLIEKANFAKEVDGKMVDLFTVKNASGLTAQITTFGARIVNLWVPDNNGDFQDVVMGYSSIDEYLSSNEQYFGACIGRYGNRIGGAQFSLNDSLYQLERNDGPNSLHGGRKGYFNVVFDGVQLSDSSVQMSYLSPDGDAGFPGNLQIKLVYTMTSCNGLKIEYFAETDKPTIVNLTNHSYFNLSGDASTSILDHVLTLYADKYTPVDRNLIPTGELASVEGTPMDFTKATAIGERINNDFEQLKFGKGYDHNWVINPSDKCLNKAATITSPVSGITMVVLTNEPGIQFYAGNFIAGKDTGKYGKVYNYRGAFCLETQHYPDSPNKADFPSVTLNPGEKYYSVCIYKFGEDKCCKK